MSEEGLTRIGDYEVLGVLGAGGMGKVFKVRNVISDRVEAMKVLLPDLAGRQELAERFLREIKILAGLEHPNIAALRTALTLHNRLVMIMEFVEGTTLAKRVEQGPVPTGDALTYIDQVLAALSYAHQRHVIHRDIKPANMMLTSEGVVKIMDFGIARSATDRGLTATGTTLGSLYYMSPEQVKGDAVDERSDLYSVGVSLYEMVTGQRPFQADSDFSIMTAHLQQPPTPPITLRADLPAALNEIILKAMAKDPGQRFQTAEEFREALRRCRAGEAAAKVPVPGPVAPQVAADSATAMYQGGLPAPLASAAAPALATQVAPPVATIPELPPPQKSRRGLYISLGALIVLAALVLSGIFLSRGGKAGAAPETAASQAAAPVSSSPPTAPESSAGGTPAESAIAGKEVSADSKSAATIVAGTVPASATEAAVPRDNGAKPLSRLPSASRATAVQEQGGRATEGVGSTPLAADNQKLLEELEQESDRLVSRAAAVDDSLNNLRRAQQAQGLGLRADISATQQRMRTYMGKAETALQNRDTRNARRYLDLAEPEVAALEKFLGR
jgi:serine/threonine-protein kinase